MLAILQRLKQQKVISALDYHFAKFIDEKVNLPRSNESELLVLIAALLSFHTQQGSVCLNLNKFSDRSFFNLTERDDINQQIREKIAFIPVHDWGEHLLKVAAISQVDEGKEDESNNMQPIVYQNSRLYLHRNWRNEEIVAQYFATQGKKYFSLDNVSASLHKLLALLYPVSKENAEVNWQKVAVATALRKNVTLISGGPGTGKTHTVCDLLLLLQWLQQEKGLKPLNIAITAPTGKAASRLNESLAASLLQRKPEELENVKELIPQEGVTIHRLLGMTPMRDEPRFNQHNPLVIDLLLIDEVSMIDMSLMAKVLSALPENCRLILLGDKDQLTSVEAGAMINELYGFIEQPYSIQQANYLQSITDFTFPSQEYASFRDNLCYLQKSYRFKGDSGIMALATAVNQGRVTESLDILKEGTSNGDIQWFNYAIMKSKQDSTKEIITQLVQKGAEYYQPFIEQLARTTNNTKLVTKLFDSFNQFRLLTALREGGFGSEQLNMRICEKLRHDRKLDYQNIHEWFHGKVIMVNRNDDNVGLYNGDIGIFLYDDPKSEDRRGHVWFQSDSEKSGLRCILSSRVPSHELAFVMTVHKSQGSEFAHTALVLPNHNNPLLSKQLIYTAITRSKIKFSLFAHTDQWRKAVNNIEQRSSGLYAQLVQKLSL